MSSGVEKAYGTSELLRLLLPISFMYLMASIAVSTSIQESDAWQSCSEIFEDGGWIVDQCNDSKVKDEMKVAAGGINTSAAYLHIHHRSQNGSYPEVAAIYASGYVRLKQNDPSIPYGSSFILGPAYWPNYTTLHNNPRINRLEIDTTQLPGGPLLMLAKGTNNGFDVTYEMMLPPPQDRETRLHVNQSYKANANLSIDPVRRSEHQGFKIVQFSSMFINEGGVCDAGHNDCHDGNAASYNGKDLEPQRVYFKDLVLPGLIFSAPQPLGSPWLDLLHTDDNSWQGNTPSVRIIFDALPRDRTITPQGWIQKDTNPDNDSVGLWLHDDGSASKGWSVGESGRIGYWLLAQDEQPEPC